jgi:hypothetical protein
MTHLGGTGFRNPDRTPVCGRQWSITVRSVPDTLGDVLVDTVLLPRAACVRPWRQAVFDSNRAAFMDAGPEWRR